MFSEKPLEGTPGLPFAMSGFFYAAPNGSARDSVSLRIRLLKGLYSRSFSLRLLIICCSFVGYDLSAFAQQSPAPDEQRIAGVPTDTMFTGSASRYEIDDIIFVGNTAFPSELLAAVIASRPSEVGIGRRIANYILRELRRNPASPKQFQTVFNKLRQSTDEDIRYFDKLTAGSDTTALAVYYRQNGFHHVQVDYAFFRNPQTMRNALIFRIVENEATPLDTIVYYGLDIVSPDLLPKLRAAQTLERGSRFSQSAITEQNERIVAMLRDNGYHSARYRKPILSFIEDENRDSVTVIFDVGKRKRISSITYVDSSASYTYLSPSVPQAFVELNVGDWYNEAALVRSVNNLYNFGLFDFALIDTTSRFDLQTDSTLAMRVLTRTRRIHTTDIGTFIGQIANTSLLEAGLSARYENRNLFGNAQTLSAQVQLAFVDLNTLVNNLLAGNAVNARIEGLGSARFAYPLFAKVFGRRVDLESRLSYSLQSLAFVSLSAPLLLETGKLYASFPMMLPQQEILNNLFLEVNFDRQRPINFDATKTQALALANTDAEREIVSQQLFQYEILNNLYTQNAAPFLTSTILTLGTRGDHRDNLFNPHKGYFLDMSADVAIPPGASQFIRLSGDIRWYESLSSQSILAARFRAGHTILLNTNQAFVPIERHFFAGGSNSVRGWNVRELRVRTGESSVVLPELGFVGQFIGSGSVMEGSVEWRYNFASTYNEYGTFLERQFSRLGVAAFLDFGNAYNSFLEPTANYGKLTFGEIFQNVALAAGIGLRWDTSVVGPFRIDAALKVYNPAQQLWFFGLPNPSLPNIIQNLLNIQIGLGHSF